MRSIKSNERRSRGSFSKQEPLDCARTKPRLYGLEQRATFWIQRVPHMCAFTGARAHRRIQTSFYRTMRRCRCRCTARRSTLSATVAGGNRPLLIATNVRDLFGKPRLTLEAVLFELPQNMMNPRHFPEFYESKRTGDNAQFERCETIRVEREL